MLRGIRKNPRTHCKRGHEFSGENIGYSKDRRYCKVCATISRKKWRLENKDKNYLNIKKYTESNRIRISYNAWKHSLKKRYGITEDTYNNMLKSQNNRCLTCGCTELGARNCGKSKLSIDHDHKTSKIRGLLCHKCNLTSGHIENSNNIIITNIIKYLERANAL